MKLRNYSFPIVLIVITLFTSCKQNLQMQGDYEEKLLTINNDNSKTALLFESVRACNEQIVKELLLNNVNVNARDEKYMTPLHWSIYNRNLGIAEFLIKLGSDVNAKDNIGRIPLHMAASNGKKEVAELLIKSGADVNAKGFDDYMPLHFAAQKGKKEVGEVLIERGADVNAKTNKGSTPLHEAAEYGYTDIVELLIKARADVNEKNNKGNTPLHLAAEKGHKEVVELLIENGADVNARNENNITPLKIAVYKMQTEISGLLIKLGADVNAESDYGNTPLHKATDANNLYFFSLIKDIVLGKNEDYNIKNKVNRINKLCCLKHFLIGKSIVSNILYDKNLISGVVKLSELSVDLSIRNSYGQTPLDIAREKGHTDIIEILEELENVIKNDQMIPFTNYITSK